MGWLTRILFLLLLVLLIGRALWLLIVGIAEGAAGPGRRSVTPTGARMARDPVCGTFVVRSRALTAGDGEAIQYFCSEQCRQQYRSRR